jgi:ABC-2 type transport system ATP-binding protein
MTATSSITAVGLRKTYGSGDDEVEAVRGVDLEVAAGEVFGFLVRTGPASRPRCGC